MTTKTVELYQNDDAKLDKDIKEETLEIKKLERRIKAGSKQIKRLQDEIEGV